MQRHHVHLSADEATAKRVGSRRGAPVVLVVDAAAMAADGYRFWRSGSSAAQGSAAATGSMSPARSQPTPPSSSCTGTASTLSRAVRTADFMRPSHQAMFSTALGP